MAKRSLRLCKLQTLARGTCCGKESNSFADLGLEARQLVRMSQADDGSFDAHYLSLRRFNTVTGMIKR